MGDLVTDVVVVGGGPAGSTAATLLARAGHDVVLLERETHPRHQIGESLLPSTVHGVCDLLGISDEVHEAGFVRKRGGTFRWGRDFEPWTFTFESSALRDVGYSFQVERARFDAMLFAHAKRNGVDARERVTVQEALVEDDRVCGVLARDESGKELRVRSTHTVDASGTGSRLARHAGARLYSRFFQNVAVYGYYRNARRVPPPNSGNIVTSAFEHGWCWFIPLTADLTSVGAVVDRRHASSIGDDRVQALEAFAAQCPLVRDLLDGARRETEGMYGEVRVRKDWSYTTERFHVPGLFLIGDAACFVDPVFSSGVHLATYAAVLAARTINSITRGESAEACVHEFTQRYEREYRLFYDFLISFYDMQQNWDGYYWSARRILNTDEHVNDAFIRLVAGGASAPADFFGARTSSGDAFRAHISEIAEHGEENASARGDEHAGERDIGDLRRQKNYESAQLMRAGGTERPLFPGGMVPSSDGLCWETSDRPPLESPESVAERA